MAPSVPPFGWPRHRGVIGPGAMVPLVLSVLVALGTACGGPIDDEGGSASPRAASPTSSRPASSTPPSRASLTATTAPPDGSESTTGSGPPTAADPSDPGALDPVPAAGGEPDESAVPAPGWLGRRTLPTAPDGRVIAPQTTPEELIDRRLVTVDTLPPPSGDRFESTVAPVEADVLARSTWNPGCPVEPEDLAHLTVSFWGFDGRPHTGELLVHTSVADDIVGVFERLHAAGYPIEEMRIVTPADLDAPPTGDGNNTTGFVCRAVIGGTGFSEHAYGLAVDINPFHNPYHRDDLVLPELAGHYLDRALAHPGMIEPDGVVVRAFADIGWSWGGDWRSLRDYHHFSHNGR